MQLAEFDYVLPNACIAQAPVQPRHNSKLMVVPRSSERAFGHTHFYQLTDYLQPGDLLVINQTKVIPARLYVRKPTGGRVELLFYQPLGGALPDAQVWLALGRPFSALQVGAELLTHEGDSLQICQREGRSVHVKASRPIWDILQAAGQLPLPPYVKRLRDAPKAQDKTDYQSMFAKVPGAVAAPTASLHFTPELMHKIAQHGVNTADVVLHVGPGTFLPVAKEHAADITQHVMHAEPYDIPQATLDAVGEAKQQKRRVIAVGTTVARALESWAQSGKRQDESRLFIYPGFKYQVIDGLITNFHLPRSTLLMLVAALIGKERMLQAYEQAIAQNYRFYSYGDAMLII